VRDLFFDEFYEELEAVASAIEGSERDTEAPPLLGDEFERHWNPYSPEEDHGDEVLVSVDGGVQISRFAYGGFVAVARACALVHSPGQPRDLAKKVKIHVQEVYDNRDRGLIPGYVRMIAEYGAAAAAAEGVLEAGGTPLVLLDGSLYLSRFPYAVREYRHHPALIGELLDSLTRLRALARDHGFPLAAVSKDSTVFYLHMELLRRAIHRAGRGDLLRHIGDATTPFDLRVKTERLDEEDRKSLEPFNDPRPLCDSHLVDTCATTEGYTHPLLLAPSIYYARGGAPQLHERLRRSLPRETAEAIVASLIAFFESPGVATTYWKPTPAARPFRVDLASHSLGHPGAWIRRRANELVPAPWDPKPLHRVLDHLGYWYCNDVEYNVPLKQADTLARFDRNLYTTKYEPFIIRRLEEAGVDIAGTRRNLREM